MHNVLINTNELKWVQKIKKRCAENKLSFSHVYVHFCNSRLYYLQECIWNTKTNDLFELVNQNNLYSVFSHILLSYFYRILLTRSFFSPFHSVVKLNFFTILFHLLLHLSLIIYVFISWRTRRANEPISHSTPIVKCFQLSASKGAALPFPLSSKVTLGEYLS